MTKEAGVGRDPKAYSQFGQWKIVFRVAQQSALCNWRDEDAFLTRQKLICKVRVFPGGDECTLGSCDRAS